MAVQYYQAEPVANETLTDSKHISSHAIDAIAELSFPNGRLLNGADFFQQPFSI